MDWIDKTWIVIVSTVMLVKVYGVLNSLEAYLDVLTRKIE
jgi:hypothetical protein